MKSPVDALWDVLAETGKAIGDGLTLAAEILCPRDHTAEDRLRSWESAAVAVDDEICNEADACDRYDIDELFAAIDRQFENSLTSTFFASAAVSAAADPSPTVLHATDYPVGRVVGGEGPGPDSVIRKTVGSGQPTDPGAVSTPAPGERAGNTICGICRGPSGQCDCVARMFGDTVSHEDLAAHITAAHRQADEIAAYEATYASTGDHIANSLLADFHITRK